MSLPDDYAAARRHAAAIDLGTRGRIAVRGADRKTFLHALLTNDIALLGPGTGCYAALLTPQGRMAADMNVFELGDATLVDTDGRVKDRLLEHFDRLIFSEDVQLGDVSGVWGCLGVYGPGAAAAAGGVLGADFAGFAPFQNARVPWREEVVVVARRDGLGLPGFLLFAAAEPTASLAAELLSAGAVPLSRESAEALRVEAGEPAFLTDMTDDTIPFEAGIEGRAVSFAKGCFPGQEVLVRIRDRGHGKVARKLVGMILAGESAPAEGSPIVSGEVEAAKEIGRVTSAVLSPALGRPIALGYVHRDFVEPGTAVTIAAGSGPLPAVVSSLPFVV